MTDTSVDTREIQSEFIPGVAFGDASMNATTVTVVAGGAVSMSTQEIKESLTSEARFSAAIVMSLPFFVTAVLLVVNPQYMALLVNNQLGRDFLIAAMMLLILGGSAMSWLGRDVARETREQAEKRAASFGPRATVPMLLCILPALFCIVMGPAIVDVSFRDKPAVYVTDTSGLIISRIKQSLKRSACYSLHPWEIPQKFMPPECRSP